MGLNREQRRKLKQAGKLDESDEQTTLAQWLSQPEQVARRGEVWRVAQAAIILHERRKVHNRWYNRAIRAIRRFFHRHLSTSISGEEPVERFPEPEPGMDPTPPEESDDG